MDSEKNPEKVKLDSDISEVKVSVEKHEDDRSDKTDPLMKPGFERGISTVSQREKAKEDRRYKFGIGLFLVLNVLLIALIAITAYYVATEKNVVVLRDSDICVPCDDLKLHPDDTIEGIDFRGDNKETCCVKEEEEEGEGSEKLIGYFIDHWLKKKLASDNREFTRYKCGDDEQHKPIIKLVGKTVKQTGPSDHKLKWDGTSDLAIDLNDGRIKHHVDHGLIEIKKSGLYQIYSQIVLEHEMNDRDQHGSASIYQHSVILKQAGMPADYNHEKFILKVSNTHCASESDTHTITSYISGAFQLTEGDKLGVRVHNNSEIATVPHMNFFGVHML